VTNIFLRCQIYVNPVPGWESLTYKFAVDCVQNGEKKLVVSVYVKKVIRETLRVAFCSTSLGLTFQTRFVV